MKANFIFLMLFLSITTNAQKSGVDTDYEQLNHILETETNYDLLFQKVKSIIYSAKNDSTRLQAYNAFIVYSTYDKPDTALVYARKYVQLALKENSSYHLAAGYRNLGEVLRILGDYANAVEMSLKAVPYTEKNGDKLESAYIQMVIGKCYTDFGDYKKAHESFYKSSQYFKTPWTRDDSAVNKTMHIYIAELFEKESKLDSALYYGNKALELDTLLHHRWSWIRVVLGNIYFKKNDVIKSLFFYREAKIDAAGKDSIDAEIGISKNYLLLGKKDSAIVYASRAYYSAIKNSYPVEILDATNILTTAYENQDSIIKFLRVNGTLKDSIFSQGKNRRIQTLFFDEQQREREIQAAKIAYRNKIRTYVFIVSVFIFLMIAMILFRINRKKQKALNQLSIQKNETEKQKEKAEATLQELKSTQSQLIQSEKMASLGELTAGIAHEIQNPLNFVNNFSELNKELIVEMVEEVEKGNFSEVKAIANDIKENEEKINHHGKRAEAIVKGMLQHSRASSGQKEPTDINALCDEYLRLSYHGLRAKDKSFNATLKTDFDESIGKVNVIPQDLGRVIMNLLTNAFYAVNERLRQAQPDNPLRQPELVEGGAKYEPTVFISTRKIDNKIEIKVTDNGNGIPDSVKEKIFQPFFTTKPTGQGTGLGLSLSYDIITKGHGGQLNAETKENEGTSFTVSLPVA